VPIVGNKVTMRARLSKRGSGHESEGAAMVTTVYLLLINEREGPACATYTGINEGSKRMQNKGELHGTL
jgi:hypothetical protein